MSAPKKPSGAPITVEARCVRLPAKAADPASLAPAAERRTLSRAAGEVLIEVKAAAVNPSDVKAATGLMPYAVFPRTPGRDYAGVIIDGRGGATSRTHRREGWRYRVQHRRRSLVSGRGSIAGAARAADPDCRYQSERAVQRPGILSRPAHLCRHRHAGLVVVGDRRGA